MKKYLIFSFLVFLLVGCNQKEKSIMVAIENSSAIDRIDEIVELSWQKLIEKQALEQGKIIVLDNNNQEIPYQITYSGNDTPQLLIFPVTISANSTVSYTVKAGTPSEYPVKTFGRLVPERKDDFAWENDRIIYRVYGPALADENPSNGYDMWLKKTDKMLINQFYKDDLENDKSYHIDHGEGLDCYKVGHTLGAGAIAPFADNKIWVEDHYTTAKVLESGALRTRFELSYDQVPFGDLTLTEKLIITLDAGSQFNKAEVSYNGDFDTLKLAAGIYLHDIPGNLTTDPNLEYISYTENVTSDAGVPAGISYIGLIFPNQVNEIFQDKEHVAGILDYQKGKTYTYYFGSGWNQWGFENEDSWIREVKSTIEKLKSPLKIVLK